MPFRVYATPNRAGVSLFTMYFADMAFDQILPLFSRFYLPLVTEGEWREVMVEVIFHCPARHVYLHDWEKEQGKIPHRVFGIWISPIGVGWEEFSQLIEKDCNPSWTWKPVEEEKPLIPSPFNQH